MSLEVTVGEEHLSSVLGDLAQRRGTVRDIQTRHDNKVLLANVPLAEMMVRRELNSNYICGSWYNCSLTVAVFMLA